MKKKILLGLVAMVAIVGGVAAMSAFEAHVINVTAKIENALSVIDDDIDFGTVFPQEKLIHNIWISLSDSFKAEERVDDVEYVIRQKPKPRPDMAEFPGGVPGHVYCLTESPENSGDPTDPYYTYCYPVLCEYLSKVKKAEDPDTYDPDTDLPAPHDPGATASGSMSKLNGDTADGWDIDLVVPCFEGMCAQDYDPTVFGPPLDPRLEHEIFGCDLWIEVTSISENNS